VPRCDDRLKSAIQLSSIDQKKISDNLDDQDTPRRSTSRLVGVLTGTREVLESIVDYAADGYDESARFKQESSATSLVLQGWPERRKVFFAAQVFKETWAWG
jgi:hypothetical protein